MLIKYCHARGSCTALIMMQYAYVHTYHTYRHDNADLW